MSFRSRLRVLLVFVLAFAPVRLARAAGAPPEGAVNVILWFDTEDYISPADDDADKRLADLLTARNIRATFKVVGEKARVLERRGRTDVIEALKRHDIGYHANYHSVPPTVSEYEADCGLLDGMAEFVRREGPGAADVRKIFARQTLACYGQPGSSWAAQAIAALPACGIAPGGVGCYVDSGEHVGFGGQPFWYAGALVVYKMRPNETRMDLFAPGGLEQGRKQVAAIADRLRAGGGGLISIYYHPCEWVTSQFWDGANFTRGANPPREQWKLPTQRTPQQADEAFRRFEAYVDFIRAMPGVRFVTASELPSLYPDRTRAQGATAEELLEIAGRMRAADFAGLDDVTIGGKVFSPADQFAAFTVALARQIGPAEADARAAQTDAVESLLGPDAPPPASSSAPSDAQPWPAFASAVLDVRDYLRANHRVPSRVFVGPTAVSPAAFVVAMGGAYAERQKSGRFPPSVVLGRDVPILTERYVAKDEGKLFSGWIIHPAGFRAPHIMDVARLQAWTLKPATMRATAAEATR